MKKLIGLPLVILTLVSALSCSIPVNPPANPPPPSSTGSLSIAINRMADWLAIYSASQGRALLYATSVKIEVKNSSGTAVISPVTQTVAAVTTTGTTNLQTVASIPSGSNYSVTVSVFNSAVSATIPVVTGTSTGVTVSKDLTTSLTVICLPSAPTTIAAGSGPWNATLAQDGESWYKIAMVAGTQYTISQATAGIGTFFFSSTGEYLNTISDTSPLTYSCASAGNYYIGVAGVTATSSVLNATAFVPPKNEGSVASPIALGLNTSRTYKVGRLSGETSSYYSFTTAEAGVYFYDSDLTVSSNLSIYLYSDPTFTTQVASLSYVPYGGSLGSLAAATTYYLKLVSSSSSFDFSFPGMVASPSYQAANSGSDGSAASPALVIAGTSFSGKLGAASYDSKSYYAFTTGTDTDYSLTLTKTGTGSFTYKNVNLYSDASFTTYIAGNSNFTSSATLPLVLQGGTTYYLSVANDGFSNLAQTYTILLQPVPFTPTVMSLSTLTAGNLTAAAQTVWYEVALTAGSYAFYLHDSQQTGAGYTLDAEANVYRANRTTSLGYADSAYTTPVNIAVPAGDTKVYIRVKGYSSGGTGTFAIQLDSSNGSLAIGIK